MELVINKCYGGYGLSDAAIKWLRERGCEAAKINPIVGEKYPNSDEIKDEWLTNSNNPDIPRHDILLVECVRALKSKANGKYAKLEIIKIPDGIDYVIEEHDGMEWVAEKHETWG